jgi:hypothetical protein
MTVSKRQKARQDGLLRFARNDGFGWIVWYNILKNNALWCCFGVSISTNDDRPAQSIGVAALLHFGPVSIRKWDAAVLIA